MTEEQKTSLIKGVLTALEDVEYGRITIELRGATSPVDIITENRTRYTYHRGKEKSPSKNK